MNRVVLSRANWHTLEIMSDGVTWDAKQIQRRLNAVFSIPVRLAVSSTDDRRVFSVQSRTSHRSDVSAGNEKNCLPRICVEFSCLVKRRDFVE